MNAGVLDLNGNSPTISSLSGAAGTVTNSTGPQATLTLNQTTATTFGGTLRDGGGGLSLTMNGSGMLTLTGTNTYSFPTTINAGVLRAGAPSAFAPDSDVVITGGTLDASIGPQSIDSLTVGASGAVNLAIGSLLTTYNLSVNDSFGGTLNLSGATAAGEQLITYGTNMFSGSFATVDLNGIPDPSLASSLQYTANALELPGTSVSGTAAWATGAGNWSVGPWSPNTAPTKAGNMAILNNASSALVGVVLDVPVSVGTLVLGNADFSTTSGFSISATGANALTMDNSGGTAHIIVQGGTHVISAPIILAGNLSVAPMANSTLTLSGDISEETPGGALEPGRRRHADPQRLQRLHRRDLRERRHAGGREPQRHTQRIELDGGCGGGIALRFAGRRKRGVWRCGSHSGRRQFRCGAFCGAGAWHAGTPPGGPGDCSTLSPHSPA